MVGKTPLPRPKVVLMDRNALLRWDEDELRERFTVIGSHLEAVVISTGARREIAVAGVKVLSMWPGRNRTLQSLFFYATGPASAILLATARDYGAVVCRSPFEAFFVLLIGRLLPQGVRPAVSIEIHGDWRLAARMYGTARRRPLAPLLDFAAKWAVRRAGQIRTVSRFTEDLVRAVGFKGPVARFMPAASLSVFLHDPTVAFPTAPKVAFLGGAPRVKGADVLMQAWPKVVEAVPQAQLFVAGPGAVKEAAGPKDDSTNISFLGNLSRAAVKDLLDKVCVLVVPSRSEGLGMVALEAFARGRPVVASAIGSLEEVITEGQTGFLVQPEDADALACSIIRSLTDQSGLGEMSAQARRWVETMSAQLTFDGGYRALAAWISEKGE